MLLHVTQANHLDGYKIKVAFNNGREGIVDLAGTLQGDVFSPLLEMKLFASFVVDKELETLVWPNGADLAPEYLYYQAFKDDESLQEQFKKWGYIALNESC